MSVTLPMVYGRRPTASDRSVERALRAEVQAVVSQLLDDRQLLAPGPAEEAQIRTLIRERIAAYQRRAATTNAAVLLEPDGVEQRLFDGMLRLGVLQPYVD